MANSIILNFLKYHELHVDALSKEIIEYWPNIPPYFWELAEKEEIENLSAQDLEKIVLRIRQSRQEKKRLGRFIH